MCWAPSYRFWVMLMKLRGDEDVFVFRLKEQILLCFCFYFGVVFCRTNCVCMFAGACAAPIIFVSVSVRAWSHVSNGGVFG